MDLDLDFFNFLELPREIQIEVLLHEDFPTISHLCRTNKAVRELCNDERLWKQKYFKELEFEFWRSLNKDLVKAFQQSLSSDQATSDVQKSWLTRMKMMRMMESSDKVVTLSMLVFNEEDGAEAEYPEPIILGNYKTSSIQLARRCIVDEYNSRVEPVYSAFTRSITNIIEANSNPINGGVYDNIVDELARILNNEQTFDESTLFDVMENSGELGVQYNLNLNPFFDLRDDPDETVLSHSVFIDSRNFVGTLCTVAGLNRNKLYYVLAEMLNHRFLFYNKYILGSEEKTRIESRQEGPTLNYVVNSILSVVEKEVSDGMLKNPDVYDAKIVEEILNNSWEVVGSGLYTILQGLIKPCQFVRSRQFSSLVPSHIPLPPPLNMQNSNLPTLKSISPPSSPLQQRQVRLPPRQDELPPPPEDWVRMLQQQQRR